MMESDDAKCTRYDQCGQIIITACLLSLAALTCIACFWDYQDRQQITKLTVSLSHVEAKLRNISAVLSIPGIKIVPKMTDMAKYHGGYEIWKPFAGDGGLNIIHDIYQYSNAFFAFHDGFNENKGNMVWGDGTDGDEFLKAYEAHRSPDQYCRAIATCAKENGAALIKCAGKKYSIATRAKIGGLAACLDASDDVGARSP